MTIDKIELQKLIDKAVAAKYEYWDCLSDIEQAVGTDLDELGFEGEDVGGFDAEDLLEAMAEMKGR